VNINHSFLIASLAAGACLAAGQASAADAPDVKVAPNGEVIAVANLEVRPDAEADFEKLSQISIKCARLEPGNVSFTITKVLGASTPTYVMYEVWRDKAALQNHFVQPYTQALFDSFNRVLSAPPSIKFVSELTPQSRTKPAKTDPKSLVECR